MSGQLRATSSTTDTGGAPGRAPDPQHRSGPGRKLLLAIHVVVAVGVLGADVAVLALGLWGNGGADPATVYPAVEHLAKAVIVPLAVLALLSGLALAFLAGWGFKQLWIIIKFAITAVLTALAILLVTPAAADAADAAVQGTLTSAQQVRLVLVPIVATVSLVINVFLAVFKPGRRV